MKTFHATRVALVGAAQLAAVACWGMASQSSREPLDTSAEQAAKMRAHSPETIEAGKTVYDNFCLACHGPEGTAIDSPSNLFDDKWYQSPDATGIGKTIREGVMEKGMPGWGEMIPDTDIQSVVVYLQSFQTKNNP